MKQGIQLLQGEALRDLQTRKLKKQLLRVYRDSPYYRAKFDRAGVDPNTFSTLSDLHRYPFFDKEEERFCQEESKRLHRHCLGQHVTCDPRQVIRISSTSGTTGKPTFTGYTQKDRESVNETGSRALDLIGVEPGDVVMHAFVLSMWIAGCPVVDLLQNHGACVVPIGALSGVERFAQIAQEVFPRVLICTPSYGEYLIRKLPERAGIEAAELGIEKLVVSGEPGGSVPHIRERLEAGFGGARLYDMIGATGAVFCSSMSCDHQNGMHFLAEDKCIFEVVDPKTRESLPLENGVEGEVVFTGFDKECAPLIRWRDQDIVKIMTEPCGCGTPGFRYEVKGRADDMLLVRGVNVYPHAIQSVVSEFRPRVTGTMRIVLHAPPPVAQPPLPLRVECAEGLPSEAAAELAREINDSIHHKLRFRADIDLVPFGAFGDTHHKSKLFDRPYEGT